MFQKFDEIENIRKWLYGVMRMTMLNYYRKKGRHNEDIDTIINDASMSFVNGFKDARIIIDDAMNTLSNFNSEKDRALFEMIAVYNYSYRKAAELFGYTLPQVRYRYEKISESLLDYLKKRGIDGLEELL